VTNPRAADVSLRIAQSPREAWCGAIESWFEQVLPECWKAALPAVVVVPTRGQANAIKTRLFESGRSHLGLHFLTPAGLRELLGNDKSALRPARADLRLLLAIAAEEIAQQPDNFNELAAKAVARAPDHLLHTLDRLEAAGWDFADLEFSAFRPIVLRFREHLRTCGFDLIARRDREAAGRAVKQPKRISQLLVTGFDGGRWPDWFLLRAAVEAAESAVVILEYPRDETASNDMCWIGAWEDSLGQEAIDVGSRARTTRAIGDSLFTEEEMRGQGHAAVDYSFVVGANAPEQAEAIALLCRQFLGQDNCTRVGIIFAAAGSLARLVAHALSRDGLPHNDSLGHFVPGLFEAADWRAWLQLQRSARVDALLSFLSALSDRAKLIPTLQLETFERVLRSVFAEVLIDDLKLLALASAESVESARQEVAQVLRNIRFLPTRATLTDFLEATRLAFHQLDWSQHWHELQRRVADWPDALPSTISRTLYLRWLEETASTLGRTRAAEGDHPYARVHLLTFAQAQGHDWSHLIFAGMNDGVWPPPARGEFARDDEISAFNRGIEQLNRRATRTGPQGKGHISIRAGHTLYLGPAELRQVALRQFHCLVETATSGIALAATLVQESAPERLWNPSELFTALFQEIHRQPLTQTTMKSLRRAIAKWLQTAATPQKQTRNGIEQTRIAYDARRDPEAESGEYDFALVSPPAEIVRLRVSEFEKLVSTPALVWMQRFLGVKAADESAHLWSTSTGKWVHAWLARIGGTTEKTFARLPNAIEIDERICAAAEEKLAELARLCAAAGQPIPDWWRSGWQNALALARSLGAKLTTADGWPWMTTEWRVDGEEPVVLADGTSLCYRGRVDLILARGDKAPRSLRNDEVWILDYKTGGKKALAAGREDADKRKPALRKKLIDGSALQLALYGLAARSQGADKVFLSLVSPFVRPLTPQLDVGDIENESDIFGELARIQQTGVFGMYGLLRSAYRLSDDYPLAMTAIDLDVLEERWARTHPVLAKEEDFYW